MDNMFSELKKAIANRITEMAKHDLFMTSATGLWEAYLGNLPDELKQEHTCRTCQSFVKNYGGMVAIKGGQLLTLWDIFAGPEYTESLAAMSAIVNKANIVKPFVSKVAKLGVESNVSGKAEKWTHLSGTLPTNKVNTNSKSVESIVGIALATKQVFERSLETITMSAVNEVLSMIRENTLYRGQESLKMVEGFRDHLTAYLVAKNKSLYVWANYVNGGRIRNTAIGTLLVDLSEGVDVETAVRKFESIMAPANYRRPTAVVTQGMIAKAQERVNELGLAASLNRRHAVIEDISIENCIWVNRPSTSKKNIFEAMAAEAPVTKVPKNMPEIGLDELVTQLSTANTVDILVGNSPNIVSILTAADKDSPSMFSWDSNFSWTYKGNYADALIEKVKAAGGAVEGKLRVSLEWFNFDDLDLHVYEPGKFHIYYGNKQSSHGELDVDMNAGSGTTRQPVENIIYKKMVPAGTYTVTVNQYSKRETKDVGFNVQIAAGGEVHNLSYSKAVSGTVEVCKITVDTSGSVTLTPSPGITGSPLAMDMSGAKTNTFCPVSAIMWSPNHWGTSPIGNKHLFFLSPQVKVEEPVRPFFNEYLSPSLNEDRKVFEMLASRLMVEPSNDQLSGLGFSTTQRADIILRVNNKFLKVKV